MATLVSIEPLVFWNKSCSAIKATLQGSNILDFWALQKSVNKLSVRGAFGYVFFNLLLMKLH